MAVLLFYTWAARLASKFVSVYVRSSVSYVIRKLWWSKQAYGKYKVRRVDVFRTNVLSGTRVRNIGRNFAIYPIYRIYRWGPIFFLSAEIDLMNIFYTKK